jgi:hypothetical protein
VELIKKKEKRNIGSLTYLWTAFTPLGDGGGILIVSLQGMQFLSIIIIRKSGLLMEYSNEPTQSEVVGRRSSMTTEEESGVGLRYGLDRVLGLTDAVFAFVVTLLVLDLVVPSLASEATSFDLLEALSNEWVSFLDYGISFLIAGAWWNGRHRNFRYI